MADQERHSLVNGPLPKLRLAQHAVAEHERHSLVNGPLPKLRASLRASTVRAGITGPAGGLRLSAARVVVTTRLGVVEPAVSMMSTNVRLAPRAFVVNGDLPQQRLTLGSLSGSTVAVWSGFNIGFGGL